MTAASKTRPRLNIGLIGLGRLGLSTPATSRGSRDAAHAVADTPRLAAASPSLAPAP
jgi:hypothetical protein